MHNSSLGLTVPVKTTPKSCLEPCSDPNVKYVSEESSIPIRILPESAKPIE